jgi:hypothetical protein
MGNRTVANCRKKVTVESPGFEPESGFRLSRIFLSDLHPKLSHPDSRSRSTHHIRMKSTKYVLNGDFLAMICLKYRGKVNCEVPIRLHVLVGLLFMTNLYPNHV